MLSVSGVTKKYGKNIACNNVSFDTSGKKSIESEASFCAAINAERRNAASPETP